MSLDSLKKYAERKDIRRRKKYEAGEIFGERIEAQAEGEPLTTLFYKGDGGLIVTVHGGGFLYNSVYDEDAYCRYLNERTGLNVASLDYTLSYERAYPTQLKQCLIQLRLLVEKKNVDKDRIALIGHSAGADLVAAMTLQLIGKDPKIAAQVLDYPALDNYKRASERKQYPFTLSNRDIDNFAKLYCESREARKDPFVSPLFAKDEDLKMLPATFIVKAKCDKLASDADEFYARLKENGVRAELFEAKMRHGFIEDGMKKLRFGGRGKMTRYAAEVTDKTCKWLEEIFKE